jgi:transposase-like protein
VAEQRYQAVLAVIGEGGTVTEVAGRWGVSRQSVHSWLARYEAGGLEGLADRSHRPRSCPRQMSAEVEAQVLEWRRWERGRRRSCGSWMWSAGSGARRCRRGWIKSGQIPSVGVYRLCGLSETVGSLSIRSEAFVEQVGGGRRRPLGKGVMR